MIKGLISLLTSGILLNPMVLIGIVAAFFLMLKFDYGEIHELLKNQNFYAALLIISALYTCAFKKVYFAGGRRINWKKTIYECFSQFFLLLFVIILGCLFIFTFSFDLSDKTANNMI